MHHPRSSRRRASAPILAAVAAVAGLGLAACSSDDNSGAGGDDAIRIEVGAVPTADHAPLYIAAAEGYFEDVGLDVKITSITPGPGVVLAALSANDVAVVENTPFFVGQAHQQGTDVQFFCGSWPGINGAISVKADSELKSADDAGGWAESLRQLEGKTLGVAALGSNVHLWAEAALREAGVDPNSIDWVQTGTGPSSLPPLLNNQVDATVTYPWITEQLRASGDGRTLVAYDVDGPESVAQQMQNGWIAKTSWLESNPDAAEAYCEAIAKANDFIEDAANRERAGEILSEAFTVDDEAVLDDLLGADGSLAFLDTKMRCAGFEAAMEFNVENELLDPTDLSCDDAIWSGADLES